MSDFYTNVKVYGNNILYRGIRNGKKIQTKIPYSPSIFVPTNEDSPYKTIYGESLKKIKPGSIKETKEYLKKYESVENFKIYGNTKFEYCLISDLFKDKIEWNIDDLRIGIIDIEVGSDPDDGGFAKTYDPFQPIISIALTIYNKNEKYLFGYCDFNVPDGVTYFKCKDELDLIKKFLDIWTLNYVDIISGWNIQSFDIPYLVNRFKLVIGEKEVKRLSPWGNIKEKTTKEFNKKLNKYIEESTYSLYGISTLDYIILYKKYQKDGNSQESYKLDFIAEHEIGENKIEYDGSLHKLYTENKQKFYEYNLQDCILIEKLNDKCRLFELGLSMAYDTKTNHEDIFMQTIMWDALTYDFLKKKKIQVPQNEISENVDYEGAYVKPPITGFFKWISTLDATSLYPSIMMTKNISPETIVSPEQYTDEMRSILSQGIGVESILNRKINLDKLKDLNVSITPNGQFFTREYTGFVPELIEKMFNERKAYKTEKLKYEKQYEEVCKQLEYSDTEELQKKKHNLSLEVIKYDNMQTAKKLCLNSCYGAFGSKFFRFYDVRIAEAITLDGQLANRWAEKNINRYINDLAQLSEFKDICITMDTDSFAGDSLIYVNGEKIKVEDYYEQSSINNNLYFDPSDRTFAYPVDDTTLSVNPETQKIEEKNIKYVMKHKTKKRLFRISVSGKSVTVTEDHSIIIERDGLLVSVKPKDIQTTDNILYLEA